MFPRPAAGAFACAACFAPCSRTGSTLRASLRRWLVEGPPRYGPGNITVTCNLHPICRLRRRGRRMLTYRKYAPLLRSPASCRTGSSLRQNGPHESHPHAIAARAACRRPSSLRSWEHHGWIYFAPQPSTKERGRTVSFPFFCSVHSAPRRENRSYSFFSSGALAGATLAAGFFFFLPRKTLSPGMAALNNVEPHLPKTDARTSETRAAIT